MALGRLREISREREVGERWATDGGGGGGFIVVLPPEQISRYLFGEQISRYFPPEASSLSYIAVPGDQGH